MSIGTNIPMLHFVVQGNIFKKNTGQNFYFDIRISVTLDDDGTLFHLYFDILFSQKLFETLK